VGIQDALGIGTLYLGADTEEFDGTPLAQERLAVATVNGGAVVANTILNPNSVFINGLAPAGPNSLYSGDPFSQAHNELTFTGQVINAGTAPSLPPDGNCCKEDVAFDGTFVWRPFFSGTIHQLNPDGSAVASFVQDDVVGATWNSNTDTLWITKWAGQTVGTWDPNANLYTPMFSTAANAGGLAFDASNNILWVGLQGGTAEAWSLDTLTLIPNSSFFPFGNSFNNTVDGLAFLENVIVINRGVPEPITATLGLMGLGALGLAARRRTA